MLLENRLNTWIQPAALQSNNTSTGACSWISENRYDKQTYYADLHQTIEVDTAVLTLPVQLGHRCLSPGLQGTHEAVSPSKSETGVTSYVGKMQNKDHADDTCVDNSEKHIYYIVSCCPTFSVLSKDGPKPK